jgi:hypothetical protein
MSFVVVSGDKNRRRGVEKSELPKQFSGLNEKKVNQSPPTRIPH